LDELCEAEPELAFDSLPDVLELLPMALLAELALLLSAPETEPLFAVELLPLVLFNWSCANAGVAVAIAATAVAASNFRSIL
jgi:hypothetical protein